MKLLISAAMAAMFAAATPAWAHHENWHDHGYQKHWNHGKHWRGHRAHNERVYVREYVRTVPVYQPVYQSNPAPAPGIHVVVPDIYIPFPR
jgi:hypothetical protein